MRYRQLLLPMIGVIAQAIAFGDGGTVQARIEAGQYAITVFTAPAPLSVGPVDLSLLLQNRNGLEAVLDADVSLVLHVLPSGADVRAGATREQAQNKLLYAARLTLAKSGQWRTDITILRNGEKTDATLTIDVAPAREAVAPYWGYLVFPPSVIVAYVVRERLISRKGKE